MKAILWDMDGVVVDSEPCWRKGDRVFLERLGVRFDPTPEMLESMCGASGDAGTLVLKESYDLPQPLSALKKLRYAAVLDAIGEVRFMRGFLEFYKSINLPMVIATGSDRVIVAAIEKELDLGEMFLSITCAEEVGKSKPDPAVYLEAAKTINVDPRDCVVFEDSPNGIRAGKAAGAYVVGITTSFPKDTLLAAGADRVIDKFAQARDIFN